MSRKKITKYHPLIVLLTKRKKISNEQFRSLIHSFNSETIKFFCECCKNAISKNYVQSMHRKKRKHF